MKGNNESPPPIIIDFICSLLSSNNRSLATKYAARLQEKKTVTFPIPSKKVLPAILVTRKFGTFEVKVDSDDLFDTPDETSIRISMID